MNNIEKKLDKQTLRKSWLYWMMYNLSSMSFERMESYGFCHSMIPVIKKLYHTSEEQKQALKRHSAFYNTEPQLGCVVNGIVAGLEEQAAAGEPVEEVISGLKVGLMGPLAGIGDSMIPGMLIPILLSIGMGLAAGGSMLGPIFYIITYNLIIVFGSYYLFMKGYQMGTDSIELLVGEKANKIKEAFGILGVTIMGGITANYVNMSTKLQYVSGNVHLDIQKMLDGVFPKMLPLGLVILVWYLMTNKNVSPIKMMLSLVAIATVGVVLGVL